jgi:hypothetical protein
MARTTPLAAGARPRLLAAHGFLKVSFTTRSLHTPFGACAEAGSDSQGGS